MRRTIDVVERVVILLLFVFVVYRFWRAPVQHWVNWGFVLGELFVVVMVLCRRPTDLVTLQPRD
jgi:D-alanyl-lipoteichoic acid acyltransferase DltB (MBOAT superfamily)